MSARELNATAASLLGFLHEGPMTGWAMYELATERIGNFWSLTRSQVYRELSLLADNGLISASERGQRDSRLFTLTDTGRQAFLRWWTNETAHEQVRIPMLLAVSFGRHMPDHELTGILMLYRQSHSSKLAHFTERRLQLEQGEPAPVDELRTIGFGMDYERMVVSWIDKTLEEIKSSAVENELGK